MAGLSSNRPGAGRLRASRDGSSRPAGPRAADADPAEAGDAPRPCEARADTAGRWLTDPMPPGIAPDPSPPRACWAAMKNISVAWRLVPDGSCDTYGFRNGFIYGLAY